MAIASDTMSRLNDVYTTQKENPAPKPEIKWISAVQSIEQEIRAGIFIFDGLKADADSVQLRIESKELQYDDEITRFFSHHFERWLARVSSILEEVKTFEDHKVTIQSADELRKRVIMVQLQGFNALQRKKSAEHPLGERKLSLTEALDAVRSRVSS